MVKKLLLVAVFALVTGSLIGYRIGSLNSDEGIDSRFLETATPLDPVRGDVVSMEEAAAARLNAYRDIDSVRGVLALPTSFARKEAAYVLAGRSSSAELQDLLSQATLVDDPAERSNIIRTMLDRLVELDPKSALAIAESPALSGVGEFARQTWYAWAKHDFDAALSEASRREDNNAQIAQALYVAVSGDDKARQARIEEALDHAPSRQTVSSWARMLYGQSPAAAAAFIDGLEDRNHQFGAIQSVAYYIAYSEPRDGEVFAGHLQSESTQRMFRDTLATHAATLDPDSAVRMLLNGKASQRNHTVIRTATRHLAEKDPDRLDELLEQLGGQQRQNAIAEASAALAKDDPLLALDWLYERLDGSDSHQGNQTLKHVISLLAAEDPDRALVEALKLSQPDHRNSAIGTVAMAVLKDDPIRAFSLLDRIDNVSARRSEASNLFNTWINQDESAALAWFGTQPETSRSELFSQIQMHLMARSADADRAMRLMSLLPDKEAQALRRTMTSKLVERESIDASLRFIQQFEREADYPALKRIALSTLARKDPERALTLVQSEPSSEAKDFTLVTIAESLANLDPTRALQLVDQIQSESEQTTAKVAVSRSWLRTDPTTATRWIRNLPPGRDRDQIVSMNMYQFADRGSANASEYLDLISDPSTRRETGIRLAQQVFLKSPEDGRRLLEGIDLSPEEREEHLATFERYLKEMERRGIYR
jgi:hypothetical protein